MSNEVVSEAIVDFYKMQESRPIPLHAPVFRPEDSLAVSKVVESGWVSSAGQEISEFENDIKQYVGSDYCIATVNGTSALHLALLAIGAGPDTEVLLQPFTFVATANAISYCGSHPHFVDIESESLGVDPKKLDLYLRQIASSKHTALVNKKTGRVIKALVIMHTFGLMSKIDELKELCNKYGISLIEDAAEALGSEFSNVHAGMHGDIGVFSFNGNKIITTGAGGAVVTNNEAYARKIRHLATTSRINHIWKIEHDELGFNYRMPNLNAALGRSQIAAIRGKLEMKRSLHQRISNHFSGIRDIEVLNESHNSKSNYWLNAIRVSKDFSIEIIIEKCIKQGILVRPSWKLASELPHFLNCEHMDLSESVTQSNSIICLPSSENL